MNNIPTSSDEKEKEKEIEIVEEMTEDDSIDEETPPSEGENIDEKFDPKMLNEQTTSIVRPIYNLNNSISAIFDENKSKIIKDIIKDQTFKFQHTKEYYLEKTDKQTIIKYITSIDKILISAANPTDIFVINHNNHIHKFYIEFSTYTSMVIETYTDSIDITDEYKYIESKLKNIIRPEMERASLRWGTILDGKVNFFNMEEDLDDVFYNESYPYIDIEKLNKEYINSIAPILIFLGPPGTGKTKLIRNLLKYMASLKKNKRLKCIFTSDQNIIEDGYIFTKFLTGRYDALILEDIDFHLTPRTDGNTSMYHLLNISNGIASNYMKNKKIILSTNLPNINNVDEALIRPGRCFDIIETRPLNKDESLVLLDLLGKKAKLEDRDYPISELYNINQKTRNITIKPRKGISKKAGF